MKFFKVKRNANKHVNGNDSSETVTVSEERKKKNKEKGEERRQSSLYGIILTILKLLRFYKKIYFEKL